jgi:hypothetical protein
MVKRETPMIVRVGLTLGLLGLVAAAAGAAAPPARLGAIQQARLHERDRLRQQMAEQAKAGQIVAATRLCRRALRLEREVFGAVHGEVAGTLAVLARLCEAAQRWDEAIDAWRQRSELVGRLWGAEHWHTTDARLDRADGNADRG